MKPEVKFKNDEYNYYNRAVGIIKKDDKFLIMSVDDSPYYHIPGGHTLIGEDSITAVKREIKEELGFTVKDTNLFCIQENFYKKNDVVHHGIEFYYIIEVEENIECKDKQIIEIDRGVEKHLNTKWVNKKELVSIDLKPHTVKELLINNKLDSLVHLIKNEI